MAALTYRDETATGRQLSTAVLPDLPDTISLRELIRLRVREEVARHNAEPARHFSGLVQPSDSEIELNGYLLDKPRRLQWERQADIAEQAFGRNGFFVLVDDHQVESLDEMIDLRTEVSVAFVKLVPLVGG